MSQSLKKGIEALLFLASRRSVGVTELAEQLDVNKSTAFRILNTFLEANMVEKNKETLKYRLGPAILRLSEQYYNNFDIIAIAKPIMERLAAQIRESVHLCVLANNSAVVIEQIMSDSRLVVNAKIGNNEPLHCSSVGKCLMAFAAPECRERLLSNADLKAYTEHTISTRVQLAAELEKVRQQGYAVDFEEVSPDVKCIAVPVFDSHGICAYSLGASGAVSRMTQEKLDAILPMMLQAAKDMFPEH